MHMNENFNFVKITKAVNGTLNIFDLGDDVINVSLNDSFSTILDENKYLYKQKSNNVYSTYLGSIVKINKVNDKYQVEILDENNKLIIISDLQEVKVKMYQIVKINDLIGVASEINNNLNSEYKYYYLPESMKSRSSGEVINPTSISVDGNFGFWISRRYVLYLQAFRRNILHHRRRYL